MSAAHWLSAGDSTVAAAADWPTARGDDTRPQGKEHMIESEISILNLVNHVNIIELAEVFDFEHEKAARGVEIKHIDEWAITTNTKCSEEMMAYLS